MEKLRCVKMDNIMKNMLVHALLDVFKDEKQKGLPLEETRELVLRLTDDTDTRLFMTDQEYRKVIQALNMLRDTFIHAGRYSDGIDKILLKILRAKYKRCAAR